MSDWISVEDELPEECTTVLSVYRYKDQELQLDTNFLYKGKWLRGGTVGYKVTHWMPLPEPPKEAL